MEEQLYLAYFALIVMFQRLPLRQTFAIVVSVTLLWRFFVSSSPAVPIGKVEIGYWHFWPTMFWLHWMLGAIAVDASLGNRTLPRWTHSLPLATVTMLFALFFNSNMFQLLDNTGHSSLFANLLPIASRPALQHVGELLAAISFFCLMNWMLDREATKWMTNPVANQLAKLGRISYSVYLVHIPILGFVSGCCEFESTGLQWIERTVLLWGVSILGGLVFHHAVEKWFINGVMPRYRRQARFVAATEA
ncbi:hypothetical protein C2E31_18340 [Rhodopirellula baltica]|nr:hypothetical protein C2E31_18340 [Rhodopirellula baltica]